MKHQCKKCSTRWEVIIVTFYGWCFCFLRDFGLCFEVGHFVPVHLFVGELQQILSQDRHPSYSAEFYSSYINILLGVFYSVCRDLRELRHLVRNMLFYKSQQILCYFPRVSYFSLSFPFYLIRLPSTFQSSVSL